MRERAARAGCGSLEAMDAPFRIDRMPYPQEVVHLSFTVRFKVQAFKLWSSAGAKYETPSSFITDTSLYRAQRGTP